MNDPLLDWIRLKMAEHGESLGAFARRVRSSKTQLSGLLTGKRTANDADLGRFVRAIRRGDLDGDLGAVVDAFEQHLRGQS